MHAVRKVSLEKLRGCEKIMINGSEVPFPAVMAKKLEELDEVEIELARKGCNSYFLERPALAMSLVGFTIFYICVSIFAEHCSHFIFREKLPIGK